jgi:ribosomal protein S18 acetylase RimI-like enzyme
MTVEIRILRAGDEPVLTSVAPGLFDHAIDARRAAEFLADSRHHLAVAVEQGQVVGFVSAVHYVHPDKPVAELWINEVSVAGTHRGRGLARDLLRAALEVARQLGCREAWVLTDRSNAPAMRAYAGAGGVETPPDSVMFTFHLDRDAAH